MPENLDFKIPNLNCNSDPGLHYSRELGLEIPVKHKLLIDIAIEKYLNIIMSVGQYYIHGGVGYSIPQPKLKR